MRTKQFNFLTPGLCIEEAAPPADSGGDGGSAPAAAEPAAEPAAGEPAGGGSEPEGAAASTEPETTYAIPDFDFNDWNGEVDGIHEVLHPVVKGVSGYYTPRLTAAEEARQAAERDRDLWKSLVDDPNQVDQFDSMKTEHQAAIEAEQARYAQLEAQFTQAQEELNRIAETQAVAWYRKNAEKLKDPEFKGRVFKLMKEEGLDSDSAVQLAEQPPEVIELVKGYMAEGLPPQYAVRMAMNDLNQPYGDGRPAAEVPPVAGDQPFQSQPGLSEPDLADPSLSPAEARKRAAREAHRAATEG